MVLSSCFYVYKFLSFQNSFLKLYAKFGKKDTVLFKQLIINPLR